MNNLHHTFTVVFAAFVAAFVAVFISACGGDKTATNTDLPFHTIAQTPSSSSVSMSEGMVARNQNEFNTLWARAHAQNASRPTQPSIDFNAVQVVGYFRALGSNGCYSAAITRITQKNGKRTVIYKDHTPGLNDICTQAIVYPAHLVTVSASPLPVEFIAQ